MPIATNRVHVWRMFLVVGVALALFVATPTRADSSQAIAQGFGIESDTGDFVAGALVSINPSNPRQVELATKTSAEKLIGVIDKNPLVVISADAKEAQVVLSGTTTVLVSDINGPISEGDRITPSPIPGIGMLATADSRVVGTAQGNLDTAGSQVKTITDTSGRQHEVHIGYVPVQVGVAYYQAPGSNFLPPFIQDVANSVAGRPVALIRVILSTVVALFGLVSIAIFMYSSVRSAVVSLGRNPLAAHNIRKSIYQIGGLAIVFLAATLLVSYLIIAL